jgi:uncharacterized membrane protein YbaN (DUF454 family)
MRVLLLLLGWFSLVVGIIGAFLPVMPTVPFLLIAVWAFAKSSPRLSVRIMRNPTFGPQIRAWRRNGSIGRKAKAWAILAMACGVGWAFWLGMGPRLITMQTLCCTAVGTWLFTRPEQ